jgi:hypothetical protein
MIFESVIDRQPGHTDINSRLVPIAFRIQLQDRSFSKSSFRQQDDVNIVMKPRFSRLRISSPPRTSHQFIKSVSIKMEEWQKRIGSARVAVEIFERAFAFQSSRRSEAWAQGGPAFRFQLFVVNASLFTTYGILVGSPPYSPSNTSITAWAVRPAMPLSGSTESRVICAPLAK